MSVVDEKIKALQRELVVKKLRIIQEKDIKFFQKYLKLIGLKLNECLADGNCFFRVIAD
jgi:hypothetical protein